MRRIFVVVVIGVSVSLTLAVTSATDITASIEEPTMVAHFIDVGQANAALLEFPCGTVLIDAGAQDNDHVNDLTDYLDHFFDRHPKLHRTLDSVIVTHSHIDHNKALDAVAEQFTIKRYIDGGNVKSSGRRNSKWIRDNAEEHEIKIHELRDDDIVEAADPEGLTDSDIDPLKCDQCDPKIHILSAPLDAKPTDWTKKEFTNENNQSLVVRVDFGSASFLFPGDLEEPGIERLLNRYKNHPKTLDIDVYLTGHHGSHNATTKAYLDALSPQYAVISVGHWDFGKDSPSQFTTFRFGHPRQKTIDLLEGAIGDKRASAINVKVANGVRDFHDHTITKRIYATAWDGTVRMKTKQDGKMRVFVN